jgi:hypothetical protein
LPTGVDQLEPNRPPTPCLQHTPPRSVAATDWTATAWNLDDPRARAAAAVARGCVACYGFGNFYAIASNPCPSCVAYVNLAKGRPARQPGSVTTTRERVRDLFDRSLLPPGLDRRAILGLIDHLFDLGPFGFRGPAAGGVPAHLTADEAGTRTVQLIAPGYRCASNDLVRRALALTGDAFFFITSANRSHAATGSAEEPAHWRMEGIQAEFGATARFVMVRHADEAALPARYPQHAPTSTTVLSFSRGVAARADRPVLTVERHGSFPIDALVGVARGFGFECGLGPGASARLAQRAYDR